MNGYIITANIWLAAMLIVPVKTDGGKSIWDYPKALCLTVAVLYLVGGLFS